MSKELLKQADDWKLNYKRCSQEANARLCDEAETLISALAEEVRRRDSLIQRLEGGVVEEVAAAIHETTDSPFARSWLECANKDLGRIKAQAAINVIKGKL